MDNELYDKDSTILWLLYGNCFDLNNPIIYFLISNKYLFNT